MSLPNQKMMDRLKIIEEQIKTFALDKHEIMGALSEMLENIQDTMNAFNQLNEKVERMRIAMNNQAEQLGLLTHTIGKYLPKEHLDLAAQEYREARQRMIDEERAKVVTESEIPADSSKNFYVN
jgi:hypothetical protein